MCGIAGIVKSDPRERPEEDRLLKMRDVLAHRGPDGKGLYVDGPAGLAHRRLAIIDVAGGEQPMSNEDGTVWVVFNGEIYNHADLRATLQARGHVYRTRSDTESIVHLYEEEGEGVVDKLRGMFAFAIWDRPRRRLLLARDRLGIKPLYFAETESELLFGSEIKALLAGGSIRIQFNEDVLPEFLSTRFVAGEETFFRGVRKLPPGHVLTWSPGAHRKLGRYWQVPPPSPEPSGSLRSEARGLRERLEAAVESHLMSDVPLGVLLSGGVDSSALAALASRASGTPVRTFAVGYADDAASELPYARLAADHVGAIHHEITVSPREFAEALPRLLWHEDEPMAFPSSVPLYFVSQLARDSHVKVVLTGEGADELFLGYNRYRVTMWNARLGRPYWAMVPHGIRQDVSRLAHRAWGRMGRVARRTFLVLDRGVRDLYLENFAVMPLAFQRQLLIRRDLIDARDPYAAAIDSYEHAPGGILDRLSRIDLDTYLVELLMKQDQMSMAASIESRVPFLDDRLVDDVARMPGSLKVSGWRTKLVLREAVKDLVPPAILSRPKMGFPTPLTSWFRGQLAPLVDEFVLGPRAQARGLFEQDGLRRLSDEHRGGRAVHTDRLWLLVNLEIWLRMNCDGERPEDVMRPLGRRQQRKVYAHSLGEDGRPVAVDDWRARPEPADALAPVRASYGDGRHDARPRR